MRNIVFMIDYKKDGDTKKEYQYSIDSWKRFCDRHECDLIVMEEPVLPVEDMHIIWQRYYLFDMLDSNKIDYGQILLVDADTIVHPTCPNIFDYTDNKYCLVHDDASYDWIIRSIEHYHNAIFTEDKFNFWEYGNSGFQIVNKTHRPFFDKMRKFYFEHKDTLQYIQKTYGVDKKLLPYEFNMSCMLKKEILGDDMLHTKLGYVSHYNGLPEKQKSVPYWMEKTYKYLYG
jgi:hypothetical protein